MKKTLLTAVLALVGATAFNSVKATPATWAAGDVILGFENAAGTKDLLVDLGNGSTFASNFNSLSMNLNADLISTFGADWATNISTGVQYGLFGLPANKSIVYASVAAGNTAPPVKVANALSTGLAHYDTMGAGYNSDIGNAQGLTVGVFQNPGSGSDTGFSTWTGNNVSVAPFATYNVSFENLVSGNLDVYGTTGSTSTQLGTLNLSSGGALSVVPEPSTYALFGIGALVLCLAIRRRTA